MPRTSAGLRHDPRTRLSGLAGRDPEWGTWIALLEATLRANAEAGWDSVPADVSCVPEHASAPLLSGRKLTVDPERARRLLRALVAIPSRSTGLQDYDPSPAEILELLVATLCQDWAVLEAVAIRAGVPPTALRAVAPLVAWPLLQACGRRLTPQIPTDWEHGYCPVCGAWPLLAEWRGLERARRLRCGRCAADWRLPWLRCAYCGERDHDYLGSLICEGQLDGRKVETCVQCRGYLKGVSTLEALTPSGLWLIDLETVELDLAARERGWARPELPAWVLDVRIGLNSTSRPAP
jgi:FdhE protein